MTEHHVDLATFVCESTQNNDEAAIDLIVNQWGRQSSHESTESSNLNHLQSDWRRMGSTSTTASLSSLPMLPTACKGSSITRLNVQGMQGPQDFPALNGCFEQVLDLSAHGKPVYSRLRVADEQQVLLYFWDDRDGWHFCGWWMGLEVGSSTVWAFNPGQCHRPPTSGWRCPWYAPVLPKARVRAVCSASASASSCGPEEDLDVEEVQVPMAELVRSLQPVIQAFQRPLPFGLCADCGHKLEAPCTLACGHLVCRHHVLKCSFGYTCPYGPGCSVHSCVQVALPERVPQVSNIVAALIELGSPPKYKGKQGQRCADVRQINTPQRLLSAYELLGEECSRDGRAAEASVAFAAAACLRETFLAASSSWAFGVGELNAGSKSAAAGAIIHLQRLAWLRASAWAKRCSLKELKDALAVLPVPKIVRPQAAERFASDLLVGLRVRADQARQVADCPVCLRLLLEPVTTRCGHTFCRACLGRALEQNSSCPLCRQELGDALARAPCKSLEVLLAEELKEEYALRRSESKAETLVACEELLLQVRAICTSAKSGTSSQIEESSFDAFPKARDEEACDAIALAVLARIPVPLLLKYHCLSRTTRTERIKAVTCVVREFLEVLRSVSVAATA